MTIVARYVIYRIIKFFYLKYQDDLCEIFDVLTTAPRILAQMFNIKDNNPLHNEYLRPLIRTVKKIEDEYQELIKNQEIEKILKRILNKNIKVLDLRNEQYSARNFANLLYVVEEIQPSKKDYLEKTIYLINLIKEFDALKTILYQDHGYLIGTESQILKKYSIEKLKPWQLLVDNILRLEDVTTQFKKANRFLLIRIVTSFKDLEQAHNLPPEDKLKVQELIKIIDNLIAVPFNTLYTLVGYIIPNILFIFIIVGWYRTCEKNKQIYRNQIKETSRFLTGEKIGAKNGQENWVIKTKGLRPNGQPFQEYHVNHMLEQLGI